MAGRRPVEEAFAAGRSARRLLVTPQRRQALEKIVLHATTLRIPIVEVEGGSLTALAGFDGHQGVAVVVEARRFASIEDVLARSIERTEPAFVLVLDSLEDPQNVGTLLRSAEAAGVHGVVFPTERQAPLSPAAVKASAGATEHLLLAPVDDLPATLTDLRLRGVRIVGSDGDARLAAREADLRGPIALVVGSEGHGLSPAVRRRCDLFVRLPMRGAIDSLNAAVAGSILLFEIVGQRDAGGMPTAAAPAAPARTAGRKTKRAEEAALKPAEADTTGVASAETGAAGNPPARGEPPDDIAGGEPPADTLGEPLAETASDAPATAMPEAEAADAASGKARRKAAARTGEKPAVKARPRTRAAAAPPAPTEAAGGEADAPPKKRTRASFGRVAPATEPAPPTETAEEDGPALLPE